MVPKARATVYKTSPLAAKAIDELRGQGFRLPDKPNDPPSVLDDVTDMDDEHLMNEFALLTAWVDYAAAQTGIAHVHERETERALERTRSEAWVRLFDQYPKTPVTMAREIIGDDEAVKKAQTELDTVYAYRRIASDLTARYERDATVLSRELTRRTSDRPINRARRRWEP